MEYNTICNNCGKYNHNFSSCIEPITSIGVICTRFNKDLNEYEYLLICRKDTLGMIDFMRGKYSFYNLKHLMNIINEMTVTEKKNILEKDFEELWRSTWHNNYGIKYRNEKSASNHKFSILKSGIKKQTETITLEDLIARSNTTWEEPEWEIPKGRRNNREKDLDTALREFEEETGISKDSIQIIKNITPYDEIFTGSNMKSYRQRYFVAMLSDEVSLDNYQTCEVSNLKWVPYSRLPKVIRSYSLEKLDILKKVNKVLEKYRIIF